MNQIRYSIVLEDGKFAGASQHTGNMEAVPLSLEELAKVAPEINAAVLGRIDELNAAIAEGASKLSDANAYIARVAEVKSAILAAVADQSVDTDSAVTAIITEASKPDAERQIAELDAQIAELTAQREALLKTPHDQPAEPIQ